MKEYNIAFLYAYCIPSRLKNFTPNRPKKFTPNRPNSFTPNILSQSNYQTFHVTNLSYIYYLNIV